MRLDPLNSKRRVKGLKNTLKYRFILAESFKTSKKHIKVYLLKKRG
jgi:hypothetical protein